MRSMTLDTRFVWYKPDSGFEWGTKKGGDRQLRWSAEKKGGDGMRYQPPTGLFRDFAALRVTGTRAEGEILRFANEYGDLLAFPGSEIFRLENGGARTVRHFGTLRLWRHQLQQMKRAVGLWDKSNDLSAHTATRQGARKELQIEIESALRDTTTPRCARVCLQQKMELFVYPVNLLAFMWLTLARLASGEILEQPCMGSCSRYIYTGSGPGLKKTGTATCGPACRKRKERNSAAL